MTAQWKIDAYWHCLGDASYQDLFENDELRKGKFKSLLSASRRYPNLSINKIYTTSENPFAKRKAQPIENPQVCAQYHQCKNHQLKRKKTPKTSSNKAVFSIKISIYVINQPLAKHQRQIINEPAMRFIILHINHFWH